jgi:hypothetical protein
MSNAAPVEAVIARVEVLEWSSGAAASSVNFCVAAAMHLCVAVVVLLLDEFFSAHPLRGGRGSVRGRDACLDRGLSSLCVYLATHSIGLEKV